MVDEKKTSNFFSYIEKLDGKNAVDAINIPGLKTVMNKYNLPTEREIFLVIALESMKKFIRIFNLTAYINSINQYVATYKSRVRRENTVVQE